MENSNYLTSYIGGKIKDLRKSRNLKLGDLSDLSGISIAMLSKIENGRIYPTIPSLIQVLQALNADLNEFFSDLKEDPNSPEYILIKRSDYKSIKKEEESIGFDYELILNRKIEKSSLEISLLTISKSSKRDRVSTEGLEYLYVIKGSLNFELGDTSISLEENDSLFFNGKIPHVPVGTSQSDVILLVIYFIEIN
ncbi:helix-turn-helix domain-containing protein [Algoriphagus zhangzhouensis]|uniref:Transcriptional regulator, XRE family with cupin sensor n=1 Tax=Algoriphagus zhangzhouensis TaxID=1073327 RepID=A0A1M7ZCC5_9BACT|nr:XRE family transcriptional regulator [Algoriphagus zhangzhouensis]TDY45545.1 XRE family transcriptional regulator [Algoriphagus zhangzhouensis]SHO62534.1 transcriptional regulator, XRE family with cupin sensor [Algoriphagus zhangzhouensis]